MPDLPLGYISMSNNVVGVVSFVQLEYIARAFTSILQIMASQYYLSNRSPISRVSFFREQFQQQK